MKYQVLVGNVGHICDTDNGAEAWREYRRYIGQSRSEHGRAAGEPVTLFVDGEIRAEYFAPKYAPFKIRKYRLWTYDVWGNARDGFEVNDRSSHGYVEIKCKLEIFNAGTEHEFATWEPTDRQLSRASGFSGVEWEGQEGYYDCALKSNGRPVGLLDEENRPEFEAERVRLAQSAVQS